MVIPASPPELLTLTERPHLIRRVQAHLKQGPVLLSAAPGYGKTALLHLLARTLPRARVLPLTPMDQDVAVLEARVNEARRGAEVLLLDDVHVLEDAGEALRWLGVQIMATPTRWVLGGRWLPASLAHSLRAVASLHLTEQDLALLPEETELWLRFLPYSREEIVAWHERTRGWPLAIAALARLSAHHEVPEQATASLEEFLATTLFARLWDELPQEVRRFLLLTGTALQFSPELAAVLWASGDAEAAQLRARHLWNDVLRRRLFVEPGTRPNFWRYHELFRAFLRGKNPEHREIAKAIVTWFREQEDYEMAIEQALADALWDEAARLLLDMPMEVIWDKNRVFTFRRWTLSLPETYLEAHPLLLTRLGVELCASGEREEGFHLVLRGARLLEVREEPEEIGKAYRALSYVNLVIGRYEDALTYARRLYELSTDMSFRQSAAGAQADALILLGHLPAARQRCREAIAIAEALDDETIATYQRDNLASNILVPMGHVKRAEALLRRNRPYFEGRPSPYVIHLEQWAALYEAVGDWARLRETLEQVEETIQHVEQVDLTANFWRFWFWAAYFTGVGAWHRAEEAFDRAEASAAGRPDRLLHLAQGRAWLARRRGEAHKAVCIAEEALAQPWNAPLPKALVALERDIALTEAGHASAELHPATRFLTTARAMLAIVRLRALLAWRSHREGRPAEAGRHVRALLATLRRLPHLKPVLTDRDPELGHHFWRVVLVRGDDEDEAVEALGRIGNVRGLEGLLRSPSADVRQRAARALAATQREEAMPPLYRALAQEEEPRVRRHVERALKHLEALPPPPLRVHFMGGFRVWRGGQEIDANAWQRPAVLRLFQYLVLHRGEPLTRDHILEELWPNHAPQQAATTLRRLLSWLRQVLEPHMRPKGPLRYVAIAWDVYTFDPYGHVQVDVEIFERTVRRVLREGEGQAIPPLPQALIAALEDWVPPVGVAPYEEWWTRHAERVHSTYVDGCLYAANAHLVRHQEQQAIMWADRALEVAPWEETAYQVKMRALARLGRRAQALAVYEEARVALARELDAPPSELLEWLVERLRQNEAI